MSDAYTWGISGTSFLWLYGGLCLVTALAVWLLRRRLLSAADGAPITRPLDVYELAMLNGGAHLAIAVAAADLHRQSALRPGPKPKTVVVAARPHDATDLEHAVYDAVERTSGLSGRTLRRQLEDCETIRSMTASLMDAGLLLDDGRRVLVNSLWLPGLALLAVGVARVVAGIQNDHPIMYVAMIVVAVGWGTASLALKRTRTTARGQKMLDGERGGRTRLARTPAGSEIPMAVALYGTGVLWAADPTIASAWSVPREHAWTGGGSGSGSGSGGGGACGGGGGCGGGGCGG